MKNLLVPLAGSPTDAGVIAAATLLARKLDGHLAFLHVHLDPAEAAFNLPFARGARGGAVRSSIQTLKERADRHCASARQAFDAFCAAEHLEVDGDAAHGEGLTASWREAEGASIACILQAAAAQDLIVMGRSTKPDGLPIDRLESLLLQSKRPMLLLPKGHVMRGLDHALIAWKDEPEAMHAITAAMPLLALCRSITIVHVGSDEHGFPDALWQKLDRNDCTVTFKAVPKRGNVFATLVETAHGARADVVVMGGYGKSPWRELVFGGVTDTAFRTGDVPLFIMH